MKSEATVTECSTSHIRTLRLKVIRPTYETIGLREEFPPYLKKSTPIRSSSVVYDLFRYLESEAKEHFLCLHLDTKNRIICVDFVAIGSLSSCIVHPREVLKSCLLSSCASIVLVHNHPSGDTAPSREDVELTERLKKGAELLGLRLLDHVIIGERTHLSFADSGLL